MNFAKAGRMRLIAPQIILFCSTILAIFLYLPGFDGPFVYDDVRQIEKNVNIQSLDSLQSVIFNGIRQTRIVQNVMFALEWSSADGATWPFKLSNLILHLLCSWLVFLVLKNFYPESPLVAAFSTALFQLHPLQVQSVSFIMGRTSLLYTLIFLLGLWVLSRRKSVRLYQLVIVISLGILTKEIVLVLPTIFFLYSALVEKLQFKINLKRFVILQALSFCYIPFHYFLAETKSIYQGTVGFDLYPYGQYLLGQFHFYLSYLGLLLLPVQQSLVHPLPHFDASLFISALFGLVFLILLFWLAFQARSRWPREVFFVLTLFIGLLPTNGPIQMINPFAEYRLYFSNFCAFALVSAFSIHALRTKSELIKIGVIFLVLTGYSWMTIQQTQIWGNGYEVYRQAAQRYPSHYETVYMAGSAFEREKKYVEAAEYYRAAANLSQSSSRQSFKPLYRLSFCLAQIGRFQESLESLKQMQLELLQSGPPIEYYYLRLGLAKALKLSDETRLTLELANKYLSSDQLEKLKSSAEE